MSQAINNAIKSYRPSKLAMQRTWYVVDASKAPLGRVGTIIANLLTGKNRPDFAPDVDMGGVVVVINAAKSVLTGKKPEKKVYFRHTGFMGGVRYISFNDQIKKDPSKVVYHTVSGMLPKNRHRDIRLNNRLHIMADDKHTFTQQLTPAN